MLTFAYDEIELAADRSRVRARPNGATPPGRFAAGWLLRLGLLAPERVRLAATAAVVREDRPFVYPLELTARGVVSLAASPPILPAPVIEQARPGRPLTPVPPAPDAIPPPLHPHRT